MTMTKDLGLFRTHRGRIYSFCCKEAEDNFAKYLATTLIFDSTEQTFQSHVAASASTRSTIPTLSWQYPSIIAHQKCMPCQSGIALDYRTQSRNVMCVLSPNHKDQEEFVIFYLCILSESAVKWLKLSVNRSSIFDHTKSKSKRPRSSTRPNQANATIDSRSSSTSSSNSNIKNRRKNVKRERKDDENYFLPTVTIFDGPSFCFIENGNLFLSMPSIASDLDNDSLDFHVQNLSEFHLQSASVVWINRIMDMDAVQIHPSVQIVALIKGEPALAYAVEHEDAPDELFVGLVFSFQGDRVNVEPFNTSDFIPDIYTSIISCFFVHGHCQCIRFHQQDLQQIGRCHKVSEEIILKNTCYICTTYGQLLCFNNGNIKRFMNLPFADGKEIKSMCGSFGQLYLIVSSAAGTLCVVDEKSFQMVEVFSEIECWLVDDFVGLGSQQLLLLPSPIEAALSDHHNHNSWTKTFLLTDFSSCHINKLQDVSSYSSENDTTGTESDCEESLHATLKALTARVQNSEVNLQRLKRQQKRHASAIDNSSNVINLISLGTQPPASSECMTSHLVSLLPEDVVCMTTSVGYKELRKEAVRLSVVPQVQAIWEKFVGDNTWVICMAVTNTTSRILHHPILVVIAPGMNNMPDGSCMTLLPNTAQSDGLAPQQEDGQSLCNSLALEPTPDIVPDCAAYVVIKLNRSKLPVAGSLTYSVNLAWMDACQSGTSKCYSTHSGVIHLSAMDIIAQKHHTHMAYQPTPLSALQVYSLQVALEAAQQTHHLMVTCQHGSLASFMSHLTATGFHRHPELADSQLVCVEDHGPLYMVRVMVHKRNIKAAAFTVHSWDDRQLLLLVHTLYSRLPKDAIISLTHSICHTHITALGQIMIQPAGGSSIHQALKVMGQEIIRSINLAEKYTKDVEHEPMETDPTIPEEGFDINVIRKNFANKQAGQMSGLNFQHDVCFEETVELEQLYCRTNKQILTFLTQYEDM